MRAVKLCINKQNPPVLNWRCWLTQVDLYNGCKTVVVVVVVVVVVSVKFLSDVHKLNAELYSVMSVTGKHN